MTKVVLMAATCITLFMSLNFTELLVEGTSPSVGELLIDFTEAILIFGAVALTSLTAVRFKDLHSERVDLLKKMEQASFEGTQWRELANSYVRGLGDAMTKQFVEWSLTDSESEIAMYILKGFSNREIATLRNTNEATVRQQACAIYRKSGLRNHRELSAYFLEDLTPSKDGFSDLTKSKVAFGT